MGKGTCPRCGETFDAKKIVHNQGAGDDCIAVRLESHEEEDQATGSRSRSASRSHHSARSADSERDHDSSD